jgi:hypothetical protein
MAIVSVVKEFEIRQKRFPAATSEFLDSVQKIIRCSV